MITYKPIIIQGGRRKDGTYPVKIRVTFKGTARRLPTTLTCTDNDLTRSGRIKNATVLQRANELIAKMRDACAGLSPFTLEGWTVDDVVAHIRSRMTADSFRLDFFEFAYGYIKDKAPSTRGGYESALHALERYLGTRELDINSITRRMVLDFQQYVEDEPKVTRGKAGSKAKMKGGASALYALNLAHIFAQARQRYNDEDTGLILIPRTPFEGVNKTRRPGKGQRNLGVELVQRIIEAQPQDDVERVAFAAFLLSFVTMGVNLADLYDARAVDIHGDVWRFMRKKTTDRRHDHAEVRVLLSAQANALKSKINGLSGGVFWLEGLHRWKDCNTATHGINKQLRRWAESEGVEPFTFNAARHTWASLARGLGIELATVDEALGHIGQFKVADIYAERNWALAWEANAKVLALFDWAAIL